MNNDYKIIFDEKEILIRNIYCAGRNYAEHVNELNNQFPDEPFFLPNLKILPKKSSKSGGPFSPLPLLPQGF